MARRPRLLAPGVLYHVIVRGNHGQKTFLNPSDYHAYLERLGRYQTVGIDRYAQSFPICPIMFICWWRPDLSRYPDLCKGCNNHTRSILTVSIVKSVIYSRAATSHRL